MFIQRSLLASSVIFALTACGGGGGNSVAQPSNIVAGDVMTPNGMVAVIDSPSVIDRLINWILPAAIADLSGIAAVSNGTVVELVQLDAAGGVQSVLATATTTDGRYSFDLDSLSLVNSASLAVRLPNMSGTPIHAVVTGAEVDVVPEAEVIYQALVTSGNPYANYTQNEIRDLVEALRLASTLDGSPVGGDIGTTIALLDTILASEAGLSNLLVVAGAAGETDIGPGDIGNYFPQTQGAQYVYQVQETLDGGIVASFAETFVLNETNVAQGVATTRITSNVQGDLFISESSSAVTQALDFGGFIAMSPQIPMLTFPSFAGETFTVLENVTVNFIDPDIGSVTGNVDITYTGLPNQTVSVPAGTFSNVVGSRVTVSGPFSAQGITLNVTATQDAFFAPGVGVVRIDTTVTGSAQGISTTSTESMVLSSVSGL